ncbi:FAD-binding protein [Stigmatella aurantiaca]|uniref:FAD linked oxidase domain protein n=1 Tax=Stigmatella aurantiaca (strain DW4/3-1) TaxID=378806 RepID=E3FXV8_STIAD|nr:FAD-binding protein [Stigmatella aurantiaca]ADO76087.1 FAD linked oxidase domain protein [Stigmatella aurantiaca DW4/3-1]
MRHLTNWARNVEYSAARLHRPTSLDEVKALVASARAVRALGSGHSFNTLADTPGELISLEALAQEVVIDPSARTVTVSGGIRYGELGARLQAEGFALANLASLPHISVAGAIATATHGSGNTNRNLAAAVSGLTLVTARGETLALTRSSPDFAGAVVGLGALGLVTSVTLDIEPSFDVAVTVYEHLAWDTLLHHFDALMRAAYSVSLFTNWARDTVDQVWLKQRVDGTAGALPLPGQDFHGATPAPERRHPLPGAPAEACSEQLGIAGCWADRLPHFRLGFTPSRGEELQSEYILPRAHAAAAIEALRALAGRIAPLLQIAEIRTMAADDLWLSMNYRADSVGFHFTWKPLQPEVEALLPVIEEALAPFRARPHWGKLFHARASHLATLYEKWPAFIALAERLDPEHKFRNDFLARHVFGAGTQERRSEMIR